MPDEHILAADTRDDKVILYEYNSDGSLQNTSELKYTSSDIFEFDNASGAITGIKSSEEAEFNNDRT